MHRLEVPFHGGLGVLRGDRNGLFASRSVGQLRAGQSISHFLRRNVLSGTTAFFFHLLYGLVYDCSDEGVIN